MSDPISNAAQSTTHRCLRGAIPWTLGKDEMTLDDFLTLWEPYGLTRFHLSLICECSESTVNHWFSMGETHRDPTSAHKRLLADAHYQFCVLLTQPVRYQEIYSELALARQPNF